jgi:hypothetical protein
MSIDSNELPRQLPDNPNLRHLKHQARDLLKAGGAKSLTDAQFKIALLYGFPSWPKLKAHVDALRETGRLKREIDTNDADLVNKDERAREERFRKIREYELMKQEAELKLEAVREAWGATLTQGQRVPSPVLPSARLMVASWAEAISAEASANNERRLLETRLPGKSGY